MGLRDGRELGHDNQGEQSPEVSGQWPVCGTDAARHAAPSTAARPEGHSGWRERGERPEEALCPRRAPGAEPARMRILGNGRPREGKASAAWLRRPERSRNGRSPCRKEQRRGGAGELPQEQLGCRPAGRSDAPRPLGLVALAGAGRGAELPSSPCSKPGAARPAGPGPRQPPAAGSGVPSLPWGWGLVTKVPVGLWSGEHGGRFSSESSPRARPASGPAQGRMSRGAVCHHLVF